MTALKSLHRPPPDRTWLLLIYGLITSALLITVVELQASQTTLPGFVGQVFSFLGASISQSFLLTLFLANLFFAYRWRAAPWARILVGAASLLVILPLVGRDNGAIFDLVIQMSIFAALALGLNIVVGLAGLLDLGYIAFFAVGAYTWGIFGSPQVGAITGNAALTAANGINPNFFWLFLILAIAAAATVGIVIGLPVLKLRGDYLAIVTLGLGEVIRVMANNLTVYTNGPQGLTPIKSASVPFVGAIASRLGFTPDQYNLFFLYFLVLIIVGVVILANVRLDRSRIGRAWVAIREDEIAAQAMGVPLVRTKLIAFASGASFAGIMGVIFAAKQTFISPESFNFFQSIGVLSMVILGGMGNIPGVILGAAVVTLLNLNLLPSLSETLQAAIPNLNPNLDPAKYQRFLFGIILVLMMLFRPEGLLPSARRAAEMHESESEVENEPALSSLSVANAEGATVGGLSGGSADVYSPGLATREGDERTGGEQ